MLLRVQGNYMHSRFTLTSSTSSVRRVKLQVARENSTRIMQLAYLSRRESRTVTIVIPSRPLQWVYEL
jgi:hypothetical protein